jgi:hypothetical protein
MSQIIGGNALFTPTSTVPPHTSSPGFAYEIVWDASGNMYIAFASGTWAKYINAFPAPTPPSTDAQPLGMP